MISIISLALWKSLYIILTFLISFWTSNTFVMDQHYQGEI